MSAEDQKQPPSPPRLRDKQEAPPSTPSKEPRYANYTRFELELEFVTLLSSPAYLSYLATSKTLHQPAFVNYLKYLLYWTKPPYVKYLSYPGPTLRALELLQQEEFRRQILSPEVVGRVAEGFIAAQSGR